MTNKTSIKKQHSWKKTQVKFNTKSNALLIWTIHLTDAVDDNKYK